MDTGDFTTNREKEAPLKEEEQSNEWKIVTSYSSETCSPGETQCRDTLHRAIRRQGVGTEGQEFPVMLRPDTQPSQISDPL